MPENRWFSLLSTAKIHRGLDIGGVGRELA